MAGFAHGNFRGQRLVVFGCGYIGTEVAVQALARGMSVTALTRNAAKAAALRQRGMEVLVSDLANDAWHASLSGRADFVLNSVSSGGGGIAGYRRSYLEGMRSILNWARSRPVGTLVYTSSTSVYPQDGGAVVDEMAATHEVGETARVLLEAETLLRSPETASCVQRWFVLRLAGIYGPQRHHLLDRLRAGDQTIAGRGEHRLNLAHRDDIVAAIWAAFAAPPSVANEIFNVADDTPTPKAELVAWLAQRLGREVPGFTGEPATGRRSVTPDRIVANAKIKERLGWRPAFPSFRDGYEKILSP